jgi:hypothetical protein
MVSDPATPMATAPISRLPTVGIALRGSYYYYYYSRTRAVLPPIWPSAVYVTHGQTQTQIKSQPTSESDRPKRIEPHTYNHEAGNRNTGIYIYVGRKRVQRLGLE